MTLFITWNSTFQETAGEAVCPRIPSHKSAKNGDHYPDHRFFIY